MPLPISPPSTLAKSLGSVVQVMWPYIRRIHQERQAGQAPLVGAYDILDRGFDETLARLKAGDVEDRWWSKLLNVVGHEYVAPEFLRMPALREWLARGEIQADIKALACQRVMGDDVDDQDAVERLSRAYAESTGEDERLADWPIRVVIAVVVAGYFGSIDRPQLPIAGMLQAIANESRTAHQNMDERFDVVEHRLDAIGPDAMVIQAHSEYAEKELSLVLKKRSFKLEAVRDEIGVLTRRVRSGDLCHAENSVKARVFSWAARLFANQVETLSDARRYREWLCEVDPNADTRIVDAMFMEMEGAVDEALQILRDIDDPDARTVMAVILYRSRSEDDLWAWFDEQPERDNPNLLTGVGWRNLAGWFAQSDRWSEAAHYLHIAHEYLEECPDLAFIEGIVTVALLLPEEYRQYALAMNLFHPNIYTIEGVEANQSRDYAHRCFERAANLMVELNENQRAQGARDWCLWLRLTDPRATEAESARREIQESMRDGSRAVDLVHFVRTFSIEFDDGPIRRHLTNRRRLGGLNDRELAAEFLLTEITMTPLERLAFLDREQGRISQVVPIAAITGMRIEALVEDGQLARAREILEECRNDFIDHDVARFRALIDANEGEDIRGQLDALYRQTNLLVDLQNLCRYLWQAGDWAILYPLLKELFFRERTLENALKLVGCMQRDSGIEFGEITTFLYDHQDLVAQSHDLASAQAWSLLRTGHWREAQTINERLLIERASSNDLDLDINLALQSGDWERFPTIINREWPKRDEYESHILIRLAALAAEVDATTGRAFTLAKLAVEKSPDNPTVLMNAYLLAVQLGRDEDIGTATWIARAIELSSDVGPVYQANFRTVVEEMLPNRQEYGREVEHNLLNGKIPLHFAADALGVPLARLLLDLPKQNIESQDGRRRTLLPIISGTRPPVSPVCIEIDADWTIVFDITSLFVLYHLELLNTVFNTFHSIAITPNTILFLFNERRRMRFHQPSRVREAEVIRSLIDRERLKSMQAFPIPPQWLVEEVGQELVQLLEAAREVNGRVVRDRPIYQIKSLMEREAELQNYTEFLLSTRSLVRILLDNGHIDSPTFERADLYLLAHERVSTVEAEGEHLNCPLYLDGLAITSLQRAGVLEALCNYGVEILIHPATKRQQYDIIEANREGVRLADIFDEIRTILRDALEEGKIVLVPRLRRDEDENAFDSFTQFTSSIYYLFGDIGSYNAICIDDRFVNKYLSLTDRNGRTVPIICIFDLIRFLQAQNVISEFDRYINLHKLRLSDFILVPVEHDELDEYLRAARFDNHGRLIESAELRTIRQTLMHIRGRDIIQQPMENVFLHGLRLCSISIIQRLWQDNDISIERAYVLSDWAWRNVAPSPLDWASTVTNHSNMEPILDTYAHHIALLLKPISIGNSERYKNFLDWVEGAVFEPLLPANADLIDRVVTVIRANIKALCMEYEGHADNASG